MQDERIEGLGDAIQAIAGDLDAVTVAHLNYQPKLVPETPREDQISHEAFYAGFAAASQPTEHDEGLVGELRALAINANADIPDEAERNRYVAALHAAASALSRDVRGEVREAQKLVGAIDLIRKFQWSDGEGEEAAVAMRRIARTATGSTLANKGDSK